MGSGLVLVGHSIKGLGLITGILRFYAAGGMGAVCRLKSGVGV